MASQQILGLSCADSGKALLLSEGSFCCLVSLCYLPLSPISSSTLALPLGRPINARPRLRLGALEMQSAPPLGRFRNAKRAFTWALQKCKTAPPLGRFRNARPRLRLGALEKQSMPHDFFVMAKSCQAPETHPGTLVTCPGVPQPQWVLYACVLIVPREFEIFGKVYPMKTPFG